VLRWWRRGLVLSVVAVQRDQGYPVASVGHPAQPGHHAALDAAVIETWNGANDFILYGKGGEFASNKLESQEVLMLSLHLLQVCLVYINTLMIQQVLAEPLWQGHLTATDRRALTPLKWQHVNPYGTFTLNMSERLALAHVE
jgi:Tn3 transposase DDE domain